MASPDSPMPGSFVYETPIPPKLDLAGASSSVFQPPSPMTAASSLCRTIKSNQGSSRKRQKFDRSDDTVWTTNGGNSSLRRHESVDSGYVSRNSEPGASLFPYNELKSPAPFVNTDYRFAGGLDGQSATLAAALENEEYHGQELDYRPNRYRGPENFPIETTIPQEGNGRKRARPSSSSSSSPPQKGNGWGKAVFNMVGGVAGKVWDFCWSGAFRGFHAGGGVGYQMQTPQRQTDQGVWQTDPGREDDLFRSHSRDGVPIPGQFPKPVEEHSRGLDGDDLNSWILVKNEELEAAQSSSSPSQGARKHARRTSNARPITPRKAVAARTGRKSVLTPGRPSSSSQAASQASPKVASPTKTDNPASAEAQKYAAKVRRKEREEDASIQRLNQQLKAMIKEGKQALGTKIEVDESMDLEDSDY